MVPTNKKQSALARLQAEMGQVVQPVSETVSEVGTVQPQKVKPEKKSVQSTWYAPDKKYLKQVQLLAFDEECSLNDLVLEGLELVFAKRGRVLKKDNIVTS